MQFKPKSDQMFSVSCAYHWVLSFVVIGGHIDWYMLGNFADVSASDACVYGNVCHCATCDSSEHDGW